MDGRRSKVGRPLDPWVRMVAHLIPLILLAGWSPAQSPGEVVPRLIRIQTEDGIALHGALWKPSGRAPRVGIALASGTGGEFYSDWFLFAADRLARRGYAVVSLNRRDHGDSFGFHRLEPSAMDHRYAVDLLAELGVEKVVLLGHSYGTVTVPYYVAESRDPRVSALVLGSALGDLRLGTVRIYGGQAAYDMAVSRAREKVAAGQGAEVFSMNPLVSGARPVLHTYEVFLDKRGPDSRAVPHQLLTRTGHRPVLAIRDPADPYPATTPPAQELLEESNSDLQYVLLPDIRGGQTDASAHGFKGREEEVFGIIQKWLVEKGLAP